MENQDLTLRNGKDEKTVTALSANNYNYDERIALLTPEEREKYEKISSTIKVTDVNSVQSYGCELSKTIAQSGDQLLSSVRSNNNNDLVDLTNQLLGELNLINVDELDSSNRFKNFLRRVPIIKNLVKTVESVLVKYDSISDNVQKISGKIDVTRVVAMRDNSTLRTIFDADKTYIAQMREYILAAKMKLKEIDDEVDKMIANPADYEAYDTKTMISFRNSLEKRIADMQTQEYTLTQSLLQVETIAAGNAELAQRADNIVNNVIPLWKNQLSNAIIIQNQRNGIEAQQKITEATNKMLRTNAENIRKNSIEVAKANEDPVISLETLQHTTNEIIQTLKEVKQIHDQGAANRKTLEASLKGYAEQLDRAISENA